MRDLNQLLRATRERTPSRQVPGEGLSRHEVAEAVNAWIYENADKTTALDANYVAKLERGVVRRPSAHYRAGLRAVLGVATDAELGFFPPCRGRTTTKQASGSMPQPLDAVEPWELADALTRSMVSSTTLEHMERAVLGYAARYPSTPPAALLPAICGQTRLLREVLGHPQRLRVRQRSVVLMGVLCGLAGNLWLDLGEEDRAAAFFDVAELAGQEAEDTDLTAWVLATRSLAPFFASRFVQAADLLARAEEGAATGSGTRRQAWVTALLARSAAAAGDHRGGLVALERAYRLMDTVSEPPHGTEFFDRPRLDGMAGAVYRLLRDTDRAVPLLRRALDHRAATDAKGRALVLLDVADCHVVSGEPEEGARIAVEALDVADGVLVRPILVRARAIRWGMDQWADTRGVADLDLRLRGLIPVAARNRGE